jgi:hypothetical protein
LPSSCRASFTGTTGEARVAVPAGRKAAPFPAQQVGLADLDHPWLPMYDAQLQPYLNDDAMCVSLQTRARGLFVGRLRDQNGAVGAPFTLYDTGL